MFRMQAYAEGISEAVVDDCLEEDAPKPCIIKALITEQAQTPGEPKEEQRATRVKFDIGSLEGMKVSMLKKLVCLFTAFYLLHPSCRTGSASRATLLHEKIRC